MSGTRTTVIFQKFDNWFSFRLSCTVSNTWTNINFKLQMRVNRKCPNILRTVSPLKEICKKHPIQNLSNTNNNGKMQCHIKKFYGHDLFSKLVCSMRIKVIGKKINLYEQAQIFQYLMPLGDCIYVFWKGFRFWSNWRLLLLSFKW